MDDSPITRGLAWLESGGGQGELSFSIVVGC
jgi:hypothetical protein